MTFEDDATRTFNISHRCEKCGRPWKARDADEMRCPACGLAICSCPPQSVPMTDETGKRIADALEAMACIADGIPQPWRDKK